MSGLESGATLERVERGLQRYREVPDREDAGQRCQPARGVLLRIKNVGDEQQRKDRPVDDRRRRFGMGMNPGDRKPQRAEKVAAPTASVTTKAGSVFAGKST